MISGRFGEIGELFFEIEVVAADGEAFPIEALLDIAMVKNEKIGSRFSSRIVDFRKQNLTKSQLINFF